MKNLKISKIQFCPVLAALSRVCQVASLSRIFAGHFWRLVREWKVQSRGLLRDFRGSAHDSLAGRPSSREKHLEKIFKFLSFSAKFLVLVKKTSLECKIIKARRLHLSSLRKLFFIRCARQLLDSCYLSRFKIVRILI